MSLPEEVEKVLDERSKLGILGDKMGTFAQYQSAQAIKDAANNPSGGNLAGLGIGLGAGAHVGQMFGGAMASVKDEEPTNSCVKCGAKIRKNAKFCPECGESQQPTCPKCKASVTKSTKFCPECGEKLIKEKVCAQCGAKLKATAKFCPECGEKV